MRPVKSRSLDFWYDFYTISVVTHDTVNVEKETDA